MSRCYWCGDSASKMTSGVSICDRHYKDFIECMCQTPSSVKSSTTPTHYLQGHKNLNNTPTTLQQFVEQERVCG